MSNEDLKEALGHAIKVLRHADSDEYNCDYAATTLQTELDKLNIPASTPTFSTKNDLPGWVTWIAQDSNGDWYGYAAEPYVHEETEEWLSNERSTPVARSNHNPNWQLTKRKLK